MENQSLFVQIPIYIYVIIAFIFIIITVFRTDKINDEDAIFPSTVLASILWPIAILMFLIVRIDQKGLDNYNKGEKEQSNNGEDKRE